jgi:type I restriction enzyme S subunit
MKELVEVEAVKVSPNLKFSEFSKPWTKTTLGSISTTFSGGTPRSTDKSLYEGTIPFIKSGELGSAVTEQFISEEALHSSSASLVEKGDLLFAMYGATAGECAITPIAGAINQAILCIRSKEVLSEFLLAILMREKDSILSTYLQGGQGNLSAAIVKALIVTHPTLPEQQKIAAFLGAVDRKIQQLKRKQALLEQYKKGVVQQLFAQELRFKREDGGEFPEWEEKRLGEILTIGSGRDYKHLGKGDIPVFGTGGYMLSVDQALYDGETVFIGRKGTIDKPFYFKGKFWTVDTLFYTHQYRGVIPQFVLALFQRINWREHNEASGVPSLSKAIIERLTVELPCIEEQTRIAGFLMALDAKVAGVAQAVAACQTWKKGLLQQMFV